MTGLLVADGPRPVQRKRTAGWKLPPNTLIVDRCTKWGNPFVVGELIDRDSDLWPYIAEMVPGGARGLSAIKVPNAEVAVQLHQHWIIECPPLMASLGELKGYNLACWCSLARPCHRSNLLYLANDGGVS